MYKRDYIDVNVETLLHTYEQTYDLPISNDVNIFFLYQCKNMSHFDFSLNSLLKFHA